MNNDRDNIELLDKIIRKYHPQLEGKRAYAGEIYMAFQAARQDWPSEDEAVEIMKTAMAERQGYKTWHEMEMNEAMDEPEQWIDFAECYRALLASTPKRQDWQDISTAPLSGVPILGARKIKGQWEYEVVKSFQGRFIGDLGQPTHWRWIPEIDLPPAPKGGE